MIDYDLNKIKAFIFDVDGVLSCETTTMGADGIPLRTVNIKDGYALQLAVKLGYKIAIITGAGVEAIRVRYEGLGIKEVHLKSGVKLPIYEKLLETWNLSPEETLFMGDDLPDYEVMCRCGLPCCPKDAADEIKQAAKYICYKKGGKGCAREVIEQVLRAQNKWVLDKVAFGW